MSTDRFFKSPTKIPSKTHYLLAILLAVSEAILHSLTLLLGHRFALILE